MRWLHGITDSMSLSKLWEMAKDREARRGVVHGILQRVRHDLATEQQSLAMTPRLRSTALLPLPDLMIS